MGAGRGVYAGGESSAAANFGRSSTLSASSESGAGSFGECFYALDEREEETDIFSGVSWGGVTGPSSEEAEDEDVDGDAGAGVNTAYGCGSGVTLTTRRLDGAMRLPSTSTKEEARDEEEEKDAADAG